MSMQELRRAGSVKLRCGARLLGQGPQWAVSNSWNINFYRQHRQRGQLLTMLTIN
jgi:hypothetical protein